MVSVVIPTHNRVDLLPRAIRSVQNQTIKDLEIIVVSDGSTDGTDELMETLKKEDPRINYISYHPGHNGNYARNTGIKASKGEYVAFLDDDDEWLPAKLEEQLKVMEFDDKIGLVYTGTHVIYVDEKIEYDSIPKKQGDLSKVILFSNCIGSTTTVMVRKSILEKAGLFDEELPAIQDYDLWIRICQISKVGVVSKALVNYYNYRSAGQVSSNTKKYSNSYDYLSEKYMSLLSKLTEKETKKRQANIKNGLGKREHRNGAQWKAIRCYVSSLKYEVRKKTFLYILLACFDYKKALILRKHRGNNK